MGIYIIEVCGNRIYVGKSGEIRVRWGHHKRLLKRGKHANRHMQNLWNKYGEEAFVFKVYLSMPGSTDEERTEAEVLTLRVFTERAERDELVVLNEAPPAVGEYGGEGYKARVAKQSQPYPSFKDPEGKTYPSGVNLAAFCRANKLRRGNMSHLISGRYLQVSGWRLADTPDDSGGVGTSKSYPSFTDPSGKVYPPGVNLWAFCEVHDLHKSHMNQVATGTRKTVKGWRLNSLSDIRVSRKNTKDYPSFVSPTKETFPPGDNLTAFCSMHSLDSSAMRKVANGRLNSCKGWKLA